LLREFAVVRRQVGIACLGLHAQAEPGLDPAAAAQRVPSEAAGQHRQVERHFVDVPTLEARQAVSERLLQDQRRG